MPISLLTVALASFLSFLAPLSRPVTLLADHSFRQMLILGSADESAVEIEMQAPQNQRDWVRTLTQMILEERLKLHLGEDVECHLLKDTLPSCLLLSNLDPIGVFNAARMEIRELAFYGTSIWELSRAKEFAGEEVFITSQDIQDYITPLYIHVDEEITHFIQAKQNDYIQCQDQGDIGPFYSLYISENDKHYMYEVIHTIAKYNVVKLGLKNKEIRKKGAKFDHVHPLRLISYLMGEGGLRGDMQKIRSNSWKWNNFTDNFIKALNKHADANDMIQYVPGFAHSLGVDPAIISSFIDRRDWHGLLNYFL